MLTYCVGINLTLSCVTSPKSSGLNRTRMLLNSSLTTKANAFWKSGLNTWLS